jgi:predicted transcriptional regulator
MAMTPRLTDEETALLRQQAEREGRSMHEVVRLAIRERIARQDHIERVRLAADRVATDHHEILERLKHA